MFICYISHTFAHNNFITQFKNEFMNKGDLIKAVAEKAGKAGVKEVVFDRGAFLYHGRVKALADAAREGGLSF